MSDNTKQKQGYKKTALGWIPDEWEVKKLKDSCQRIMDGTHFSPKTTSGNKPYVTSKNIRMGAMDLSNLNFISEEEHEAIYKRCPVQRHDILLTKDGANTGNVCINDLDYPFSLLSSVAVLRPAGNTDFRFLFQLLSGDLGQGTIKDAMAGQAITRITLEKLCGFKFPFPPLPEQRAIAGVLGCWDKAIGTLSALIAQKQARKKWLMQVLLTGKMRLPGFSDGSKHGEGAWRTVRLGDVGDFSKGSGVTKDQRVAEGLPCIRYGEIYTVHDIQILKFHSFISAETAMVAKRIQQGDIIFAGSGETAEDIGKCVAYLFEEEAYAGGDTIILRPNEGYDSLFLGYLLNGEDARREKSSLGKGNSVVHLYPKDLMEVTFQMPDYPEQKAIANVLATCDRELRLLDDEMDVLKVQKKGLMQELLTGRKRISKPEH